ncbi:hypothetical protein [Desertivirga arenae]|uniref:hypothetical protein n=1 Tax=Desertivirga arenae TaxID=2810309 RepID=UPI001A964F71|nr:hypothetical protein [Pedobacter sp. SYSU D00823]
MNKRNDSFVLIGLALVIFLFLYLTGTITSGYHNTDDHEILDILKDVKKLPIQDVIYKWIENDLNIRYRPMYFVHRVLQTAIFQDDLLLWSIYNYILCVCTFFLFYKGMRNLRFSILESLLFNIIAFWGTQIAVWWMLGPNETIGCFFLSISFYFLSKCNGEKYYTKNSMLFTLFLALSSLSKESFTLIIPAMILLKVSNEKEVYNSSWEKAIRKNRLQLLSFLVLLFNLLVIVLYVGTNKIGYAGVDQDVLYKLKEINQVLGSLSKYLLILGISFLGLLVARITLKKGTMKDIWIPIFIFLLIAIPNILLYTKSGMSGRYFLPATIGFAFIIIFLLRAFKPLSSGSYWLLILISLFILKKPIRKSVEEARNFAKEGHENNELLAEVLKFYHDGKNTVLAADPVGAHEASSSIFTYLNFNQQVKLYAYEIEDKTSWGNDSVFAKRLTDAWRGWFSKSLYKDMKGRPDMIIFLKKDLSNRFFTDSKIDSLDYTNTIPTNSRYSFFVKKQ